MIRAILWSAAQAIALTAAVYFVVTRIAKALGLTPDRDGNIQQRVTRDELNACARIARRRLGL